MIEKKLSKLQKANAPTYQASDMIDFQTGGFLRFKHQIDLQIAKHLLTILHRSILQICKNILQFLKL